MKRVAKPLGKFNIALEEALMPSPGSDEVRMRAVRTLISRGSEIGRRYVREERIEPHMMGYSFSGIVDAVGSEIDHFGPGDRVVGRAPHAQYVVRNARPVSPHHEPFVFPLDAAVTFDQAPYWFLTGASVTWARVERVRPDDVVAIVGQGLVGSLLMQVHKANGAGRIVAIDALDLRCQMAADLGADVVIDASKEDPVTAVRRLTGGFGADVVVYAVGGPGGPKAFEQCQDMLAADGLLHILGRYENEPLPLFTGKGGNRRIVEGNFGYLSQTNAWSARRAMDLLGTGAIDTERMTTHRFPFEKAADAFDLLYNQAGSALGVLLDWDATES